MSNWLIPCNLNNYNIIDAVKELEVIDWKQTTNINVGDTVYIYAGKPVSAIICKCNVQKIDMDKQEIDDTKFIVNDAPFANSTRNMRLFIEEIYDNDLLKYEDLVEHGASNVQGPSKISEELYKYIRDVSENDDLDIIKNRIKDYDNNKEQYLKKFEELNRVREEFVNDYSINKLLNLPLEEYVVGFGERTFSYRLEEELEGLGNMHGQTSEKFGLWYGTRGNDQEDKYRWAPKFGETKEEAYRNVITEIVDLIDAGSRYDIKKIRECRLHVFLSGKVLATYFPEKYLPIFANPHLEHFLNKIGINYKKTISNFDKQLLLLDWKNNNPTMKDWSIQLFADFLYQTFDKPVDIVKSEIDNKIKDNQDKRDEEYPKEYAKKSKLTIKEWKELLNNEEVFRESDIEFLKRIYKKDNHAATCKELSIEDDISPKKYIWPVVKLAKRIIREKEIKPNYDVQGNKEYWSILFWGRYTEDNYFEWKIQPKLVKAMEEIFPDIINSYNDEEEKRADDSLVDDIARTKLTNDRKFEYDRSRMEKERPIYQNGHKTYPRDRQKAKNALAHAGYKCEINPEHKTFKRKSSGLDYTEPHHLIPLSRSGDFEVSLDREQNIISLCSNCHNEIHYGEDAEKLIKELYEQRKELLEEVGIKIGLDKLIIMYK